MNVTVWQFYRRQTKTWITIGPETAAFVMLRGISVRLVELTINPQGRNSA